MARIKGIQGRKKIAQGRALDLQERKKEVEER